MLNRLPYGPNTKLFTADARVPKHLPTFKFNWTLTSSVVALSFAMGLFANAALLRVVHHLLPRLAALGRRSEELGERVDQALGLVVEAQAALRHVVVVPQREEQPVVAGVALARRAGGRVGRERALPPPAAAQLLEGPARPAGVGGGGNVFFSVFSK